MKTTFFTLTFLFACVSWAGPQLMTIYEGWTVKVEILNEGLKIEASHESKGSKTKIFQETLLDVLELKTYSSQNRMIIFLEAKAPSRGKGRVFHDSYILVFDISTDTPVLLKKELLRTAIHDAKGIYVYPDYQWKFNAQESALILFDDEKTHRHEIGGAPQGRHGIY